MTFLYLSYLGIQLSGISLVVWLYLSELRNEGETSIEKLEDIPDQQKPNLFNQLNIKTSAKPLSSEPVEGNTNLKEELALHSEIKNKYDKLEILFQEKSEELENTERALVNEISNRKEFEKVEELMEQRIVELKEKYRYAQVELTSVQAQRNQYQKENKQLEAKIDFLTLQTQAIPNNPAPAPKSMDRENDSLSQNPVLTNN